MHARYTFVPFAIWKFYIHIHHYIRCKVFNGPKFVNQIRFYAKILVFVNEFNIFLRLKFRFNNNFQRSWFDCKNDWVTYDFLFFAQVLNFLSKIDWIKKSILLPIEISSIPSILIVVLFHSIACHLSIAMPIKKKHLPPSSVITSTVVAGPGPSGLNTCNDTRYCVYVSRPWISWLYTKRKKYSSEFVNVCTCYVYNKYSLDFSAKYRRSCAIWYGFYFA